MVKKARDSNVVDLPIPTTRTISIPVFALRSDTPAKQAIKIIEAGLNRAWNELNELEDYYYARGPEPFLRPILRKPVRRPRRRPTATIITLKQQGE